MNMGVRHPSHRNDRNEAKMNLQQLKYVLAIYKEGSITRAAHALYCAQPNVSSALKSLERELHIRIFDRTPNGVELTPQGEAFISHAANIMAQVELLENIGSEPVGTPVSLGISVSRASYCSQALSRWMNEVIDPGQPLSLHFCETNTEKVIDQVFRAESDLGVIRIPAFYESFYGQLLANKNLSHSLLMRFKMLLVMRQDHPLALEKEITADMLSPYTEVVHGDHRNPSMTMVRIDPLLHETPARRIYVYDRGSQIDLLKTLPGAYMWASPIPEDILEEAGMVLRSSPMARVYNLDLLIGRKNSPQTPLASGFASYLKEYAAGLAALQACDDS